MMENYLKNQLHDDEKIVAVVRRSPLAHLAGWFFSVVLIIADFFFLVPLLQRGRWGLFAFLAIMVIGLFLLIRTFIMNRMNVLLITSSRVIDIDQRGMLHRVVSECMYQNIQEMTFDIKGFLGTIFHVGTLRIHTAGNRADIAAEGIKHPQRIQELIGKIQRKISESESSDSLSAEELVALLEKIKSHINVPLRGGPEEKKTDLKRRKINDAN